MDLQSFQKGIKELTALPDGEVERALIIASALDDDEREEFFRRLKVVNDEIASTYQEEEEALQELEHLERDMAVAVKTLERGTKEQKERSQEMGTVEQKLTTDS